MFNIFINSLDGGIEYTVSKFSGHKKRVVVPLFKRVLIRLREWAKRNSLMFNK